MLSIIPNLITKPNFKSLLFNSIFQVSRQKFLLRRRKMTSKKQKVAKKKFLEKDPQGSYTHQLKILQIQKQLDKKVSRNHHLNQLMDQLFYPDIRYANQKLVENNLLKMSLNYTEKNIMHTSTKSADKKQKTSIQGQNGAQNKPQQQQQPEYQQYDKVIQQIYLCQIPSQLFELYLKNQSILTHEHLVVYFKRLKSYFKNRLYIQQKITKKWKQSLDKLKLTQSQKNKKKKCPYEFIQQEQIIRNDQWNLIVKNLTKKIQTTTQLIANQNLNENQNQTLNEELQQPNVQDVDQSFFSIQNNCDLLKLINIAIGYAPQEIWNAIVKKMLVIVQLNKSERNSEEKLPIFTLKQKVKLLNILTQKNNIKSTMTRSLLIQSPQQSKNQQEIITAIGKKLCQDIAISPQSTAQDIGIVINTGKGYYRFINTLILDLLKPRIIQNLSSTNLQRSIDYLFAYWTNGTSMDKDFLQILKFDIYRKLPYSLKKRHLFYLLSLIQNNQILLKKSQIAISISQIYPRIAQTLAQYLNKGQLTHEQIKTFLKSIYNSYPLYKIAQRSNILQMISTAVIKIGQGYKLQQLTQILYKIVILGHKSKIFCRYIFQRYQKQYHKLMKQYKQSRTQLITDKKSEKQSSNKNVKQQYQNLPSMNQLQLQQSLIMMLWSYVVCFKHYNTDLPLSDMLELYPVHIHSQDEMIRDLIGDLNYQLEDFKLFPKIKHKYTFDNQSRVNLSEEERTKMKKISRALLFLKTNTKTTYQYIYTQSICKQVLDNLQISLSINQCNHFELLSNYIMRYFIHSLNPKQQASLPNRWNDSIRNLINRHERSYQNLRNTFNGIQQNKIQQKGDKQLFKRFKSLLQKTQKDLQNNKRISKRESILTEQQQEKTIAKPYQLL